MTSRDEYRTHRKLVLDLALAGHKPRALAAQFPVTEWTIKRWLAHARRRRQLPYWRHMGDNFHGGPN
jgi:transposase